MRIYDYSANSRSLIKVKLDSEKIKFLKNNIRKGIEQNQKRGISESDSLVMHFGSNTVYRLKTTQVAGELHTEIYSRQQGKTLDFLLDSEELMGEAEAIFRQPFLDRFLFPPAGKKFHWDWIEPADQEFFVRLLGRKARIEGQILQATGKEDKITRYLEIVGNIAESELGYHEFTNLLEELQRHLELERPTEREKETSTNVYTYDSADGGFSRIRIPSEVTRDIRDFIGDFVGQNSWTQQNQYYGSPAIFLRYAGQDRNVWISVPSIFEIPKDATKEEKLKGFEIGVFISPTEWVRILDGQEVMEGKPVFSEPFLHAILSGQNEQRENEPWSLIDPRDRVSFARTLNSQIVREKILQKSLGEGDMGIIYLNNVQKACREYRVNHNFERLETKVQLYRSALTRVEGLVSGRKEARG